MSPSRKLLVRLSLLILFMLLLSACGDGDGDGGGSNTYSVGGSVSGLVGTLVLQNNAGDDLTITADGNFTFPTRLASGSAFQVSVSSQPSNQTCNVSNGSGTVSGNITSVDVACTRLYSTIGGSLSGLSGTLVLQNNASDDLTLTSDGSFTFTTPLGVGGTYNVTVSNQPANQICSVSNGSGTASANVTSVDVTCVSQVTVGGSVSGLNGTLVLQNNGGDDLRLTTNGSFTFTTRQSAGDTYNVTVGTQPTNQICTVSRGTGTASANVTSVSVACASQVTVGGSVSGLSGTLVLQNNGGDDLSLAADGSFAFGTEISVGATYTVTVASQPANEVCYVSNGNGTASGDVTDVRVDCASILTRVGSYGTGSPSQAVVVGNYAYVAAVGSFMTVDISDPSAPVLQSTYKTIGPTSKVAVSGNYAYLGGGKSEVTIMDISSPTAPASVGTFTTSGTVSSIRISGSLMYVTLGNQGLDVIDISDPLSPALVSNFSTAGYAYNVTIDGGYAYIADDLNGMEIVDITDAASLSQVGVFDTAGRAIEIAISGNYAYVADDTDGLKIIDISNPASPSLTGQINPTVRYGSIVVSGSYAYLGDNNLGKLVIIDISDPASPALQASISVTGYPRSIFLSGNHLVLADMLTLGVADISDPLNVTIAGELNLAMGTSNDIAVSGSYAYVSDFSSGLQVFDISNPASPQPVGNYATNSSAMALSGNYAYLVRYGLQVVDVSNPAAPTLAASVPGGAPQDVVVVGSYAYLADYWNGLRIFDVSDPATPAEIGNLDFNSAYDVAVAGGYAYVADASNGLKVIDVSDPNTPTLVTTVSTGRYAYGVAVSGNYVYLADSSALDVFDVSNPASPSLVSSINTGFSYRVTIKGNYAYVADRGNGTGLTVLDISDPAAPRPVAVFNEPYASVYASALDDANRLYLAEWGFGLDVLQAYP